MYRTRIRKGGGKPGERQARQGNGDRGQRQTDSTGRGEVESSFRGTFTKE